MATKIANSLIEKIEICLASDWAAWHDKEKIDNNRNRIALARKFGMKTCDFYAEIFSIILENLLNEKLR